MPSIGQNLQPLTGIGDVSIRVKNIEWTLTLNKQTNKPKNRPSLKIKKGAKPRNANKASERNHRRHHAHSAYVQKAQLFYLSRRYM